MTAETQGAGFVGRVAGLFVTRVFGFLLGLIASFLLARLLGPEGRGAYALVLLVPTTLITVGQLGIPSALVYYSGRSRSLDELRSAALVLVPVLSLVTVVPTLALAGELRRTVLFGTPTNGIELILVSIPFLFASSFASSILLGRQAIRTLNLISVGQTLASLVLLVILVGVAGLGVVGAIVAYLITVIASTVAAVIAALRLAPIHRTRVRDAARNLLGYAAKVYPGSVAQFFSYRADVFLINLILASPREVGLYGLAVGLAELVFYVPDAIATAFFPRVASSEREEADRLAPEVTRLTVLMTTIAAVALIPFAVIAIHLILPDFVDSIPPLVVITPGIVALSIAKVLSGYVSGLGKPFAPGAVSIVSLAVNLAANLVLIPRFGIVGAAAASLISYSTSGLLLIVISSRLAGVSSVALVVPQVGDLRRMATLLQSLVSELAVRARIRLAPRGS